MLQARFLFYLSVISTFRRIGFLDEKSFKQTGEISIQFSMYFDAEKIKIKLASQFRVARFRWSNENTPYRANNNSSRLALDREIRSRVGVEEREEVRFGRKFFFVC